LFLNFDIPLIFACLREAASAKAGILTFEIKKLLGFGAFLTIPDQYL